MDQSKSETGKEQAHKKEIKYAKSHAKCKY